MKFSHTLLLASTSQSRQELLRQAQIPFTVISQTADETACDWNKPLQQLVATIATYKMDHVIMPPLSEGAVAFVLTADTLCHTPQGNISGKPIDRTDAIAKIKEARGGFNTCATAFCLDRKIYRDGTWHVDKRILKVVESHYIFEIPDHCIESYLAHSIGLKTAGAIAIEGYGEQFLKEVRGSYSTIIGVPLYELRIALEEVGFIYSNNT